jgi:RNA-directed DNA polymerase
VAVFKLERRIYKASHAGDLRRVHRLQTLLLKSRAAKLLAVRRVTQDNQGKNTAGIDGITSLAPHQRCALAAHLGRLPIGRPTRRVWIPQPGKDEKRPLSIPTLHARALQALVKLALEPEWEARFEPNSYGFRPGRSVHDASGAICIAIEKQPKYALDADIAKCFDCLDQAALLRKIKTFPTLHRLRKAWRKAGGLDNGVCVETPTGTPQGGVLSPLLANIALHGLEEYLRTRFPARTRRNPAQPGRQLHGQPQGIRYADDVRHITRRQIPFTERRGSEDTTPGSTTHLEAKAKGDNSMSLKRRRPEGVYDLAPQDPRDTVRALLPKPQFPAMEAYIPCPQRLLAGSP